MPSFDFERTQNTASGIRNAFERKSLLVRLNRLCEKKDALFRKAETINVHWHSSVQSELVYLYLCV